VAKRKLERGITTVQLSISTKDELLNLGKKGETYDDVIRRLIDSAKIKEKYFSKE